MSHPYIQHLSKDTVFRQVLENAEPRQLKKIENLPLYLYQSVINQQLSTRVGAVIYERFLNLYNGTVPASQQVADTPVETLRSIGLSGQKASYIQNVARFDLEEGLNYETLNALDDEGAIKVLTSIKGIGKWSAQNFLMAALGREDVFSGDDLILQSVVAELYGLDKTDKKKFKTEMHRIAAQWSPYRTYASLHLWQWNSKK